jgi:hypothetical protein
VNIVADYFIDPRADLLIAGIPVSGILGAAAPGAASPTINAGTVRNEGGEFSISYKNKFSDNFNMSLGYNVTLIKNNVTEINGANFLTGGVFGIGQQAPSRMEVGHSIGYFYGLKSDGIFQNQTEIDNPYIDSRTFALSIAQKIVRRYKYPNKRIPTPTPIYIFVFLVITLFFICFYFYKSKFKLFSNSEYIN